MNNLKNKIIIFILFSIGLISVYCLNLYTIQKVHYDHHITLINLIDKYDLEIHDVLDSLENEEVDYTTLEQYGIDLYDQNFKSNTKSFVLQNVYIFIVYTLMIGLLFYCYRNYQNKRIRQLTYYIEEINKKNYTLDIKSNKDDMISFLQNEIYKTMVYLNEVAELSLEDKKEVKKNLEDITHQIKTPLTAIMINLDNLMDDETMEQTIRTNMIRRIYKDSLCIQVLIENLLKLSKFDVNGIAFNSKKVKVNELIHLAIDKVSPVLDLYDVDVHYVDNNYEINVDMPWQVEAMSNMMKNACENHCKVIEIVVEDNPVYTLIKFVNDGQIIHADHLVDLFKRFNSRGKGSGIGLALTRKIIELDNGLIIVKNNGFGHSIQSGVSFEIKYFK